MVRNEANLLDFQSTILYSLPETNGVEYAEPYSSITLDFGKEVCGPVTIQSGPATTLQTTAFAYAESSQWVGFDSDDASSLRSSVVDGSFEFQIGPNQTYTVPIEKQRGGYRYLTIFPKTRDAILGVKGISAYFTSMPHWQNLRAYPSYFFCNDELLNRLWYASAYTNQLATLAKDQSRRCDLDFGWLNNAICCTSGDTVIPWAGPPIYHDSVSDLAKSEHWPYVSDSYHLWTILVARRFYHLTGDLDWLKQKWEKIVWGMQLSISRVGFPPN
jgi:hypothetical protein